MDNNGIATSEEFRRAAEAESFEPERKIMLPHSKLAVLLRRPRPLAFSLDTQGLPATLAARFSGVEPFVESMTPEELRSAKLFWIRMFARMFVNPTLSLSPQNGQIHPAWLSDEDQAFLIRWAVGEVDDANVSLAPFRSVEVAPGAGEDSANVGMPTEPAPAR